MTLKAPLDFSPFFRYTVQEKELNPMETIAQTLAAFEEVFSNVER